jgi:hypothetical protein
VFCFRHSIPIAVVARLGVDSHRNLGWGLGIGGMRT